MKRYFYLLCLFLIMNGNIFAQVEIGGDIKTDNRFRIEQDGLPISWNLNQLRLELRAVPSYKIRLYSDLRIRAFGFPNTEIISDLQRKEKDKVNPWGLEFNEAYADLSDFLIDNLDIRIGRQRIAWGTADKFNPTDNLNPDDIEDLFDFGKHLGSNALKASYYLRDFTFTGIIIPTFAPAVLPSDDWLSAFQPAESPLPGFFPREIINNVDLPLNKVNQTSMFALKAETRLFDYDVSLSYFYGRDDFPLLTQTNITSIDTLGTVDITTHSVYPKIKVLGADFAGQIFDIGMWAEAAVFFPDKYSSATYFDGTETLNSITLDDDPYIKYVIGGDYTFKNGIYINTQFIHGLFNERGNENLGDYFVFEIRKDFLNNKLRITFAGGAVEIRDFNDIKNSYGLALGPEITYYPVDNAELVVGSIIIEGKESSLLGKVKQNDELYFKIKYSF